MSTDTGTPLDVGQVENVDVQMQLIHALVVDEQGRTVPGLSKDDFEMRIDDEPVAIDTLDVNCVPEPIDEVRSLRFIRSRAAVPVPDVPRKIVLVIDYLHLPAYKRAWVLDDLVRMFRYGKSPGDEVMVVALAGLVRLEQPFTTDRDELIRSLERMNHDITLWLPTYEHYTMGDFFNGLTAILDVLKKEDGLKAVVLYSQMLGRKDMFEGEFHDIAGSAQEAGATIDPVYVLGMDGGLRAPAVWLARLASETGGRFSDFAVDRTIGYAVAQRDLGCRYTLGFYSRVPTGTKVGRVSLTTSRPGLRMVFPEISVARSPGARQESYRRSALYFPDAYQSRNVRGYIFPKRPKKRGLWETTLVAEFPAPKIPEGGGSTNVDFGGTLWRSNVPIYAFNRRLTLRSKSPGEQPEREVVFLQSLDLKPGRYTLSLVIDSPQSDLEAAKLDVEVPPVPSEKVFAVGPIMGRLAGTSIVIHGNETDPTLDKVGSRESFRPLLIAQLDKPETLLAHTRVCIRGAARQQQAVLVERKLTGTDGAEIGSFEPLRIEKATNERIWCREVIDTLPQGILHDGDHRFEVSLGPKTAPLLSRFAIRSNDGDAPTPDDSPTAKEE